MKLRPYQRDAVNEVMGAWRDGHTDVLLVMPTAGGKTVCAEEIVARARAQGAKVLWICHRQELVDQAAQHLSRRFKDDENIHITTIQGMLASGGYRSWPKVDLIVADEAHHLMADEWRLIPEAYQSTRMVGLTATPERADGRPLGDIFSHMVVATDHEFLVENGYIVDCDVISCEPDQALARHPVALYNVEARGKKGFCFCRTIEDAEEYAEDFRDSGINAAVISARTDKDDRKRILQDFRDGKILMICNVYTMTEGVDVPDAEVCILARGCSHASNYLQMTGRVLRPSKGKDRALLIDLIGVVRAHGIPTEKRQYSLTGQAISRSSTNQSLKICEKCGFTDISAPSACKRCGHVKPVPPPPPRNIFNREVAGIYSVDDRQYFALAQAKLENWIAQSDLNGQGAAWASRQYKQEYGNYPSSTAFTHDQLKKQYWRYCERYPRKQAGAIFKSIFGFWPH